MLDNEYYIKKWLEGSLSEEELKTFQSFDDYEELEKLSNAAKLFKAPDFDIHIELERIKKEKIRKGKVVKMPLLNNWIRIAASVTLLFATFLYFYLYNDTTRFTEAGEKGSLYLPDSSRIELNASSSIAYKKRLWKIKRKVSLDGEAFFDVAKGSKFDVFTSGGMVSVLGTEFNVKNRSEFFEVICFEGSVGVEFNNNSKIIKPGESIRILNGEFLRNGNLDKSGPSWLNGESSFDSVVFKEVVAELERQYGVNVSLKGLNIEEHFTGKFVHYNLQMALKAITIPFNLEYQIIDEHHINLKTRQN